MMHLTCFYFFKRHLTWFYFFLKAFDMLLLIQSYYLYSQFFLQCTFTSFFIFHFLPHYLSHLLITPFFFFPFFLSSEHTVRAVLFVNIFCLVTELRLIETFLAIILWMRSGMDILITMTECFLRYDGFYSSLVIKFTEKC